MGFTVASERSMAALYLRPLAEVCDVFDRDLPAALEPLLHLRHSVVWDGPTVHVTKSVMLIACEDFMVGGALAPLAASFADELPAKHMIVTPGKRESDITGAFFVAGARGNPLRKVVDYEHGVVEHRRTYSSDAFRLMLGTEYANGMGYEVISGIPGVHPKLETDFIQYPKELQDVLSVIPSVAVSAFTPQCRIVSVVRSPDLVKGQWDVILAGSVLQNLRVGRFFAPFTLISMAWQWQVKYVAGGGPHEGDILVEGEEGALRRLVGACYQMGIPIECCGIADWMLGGAKREFTDQLAAFAFPGPRFEVPEGYFTRTLEPLGDGPFFYRFLAREGVVTAESMWCFHTTSNSRFSVNHS